MDSKVIYEFDYMFMDDICSTVKYMDNGYIDVVNFNDNPLYTAFGVRGIITLKDLDDFMQERCFPRTRVNCDEILKLGGIDGYSELAIIKKTHGVMAHDKFWVRFADERGKLSWNDVKVRK